MKIRKHSAGLGFGTAVLAGIILSGTVLEGCGSSRTMQSADLMTDISADDMVAGNASVKEGDSEAATDFAVRLFQQCEAEGENILISPVSMLFALSMTANGAEGDTQEQMEAVLGLSAEEWNQYLCAYRNMLPSDEKYQVNIANSIWLTDDERFTVNQDFLQTNANYYEAGIYQTAFDEGTVKDINKWVRVNTDGMIKEIVSEIPEDAVMYLVNSLSFDAEWQTVYDKSQIRDGEFTAEDGTVESVQMMYSEEYDYLESENATGFVKYYEDYSYAFVALLPDEGVTVEEYVESLTGDSLREMLNHPESVTVEAAIPKFESESGLEMSDLLVQMGMEDAFDEAKADFSGLGTSTKGNIFINRVIHKTSITVDAKGTKAGAATAVETVNGVEVEADVRTVYLDRPFVYMIVDCEEDIPIFIGTLMHGNYSG